MGLFWTMGCKYLSVVSTSDHMLSTQPSVDWRQKRVRTLRKVLSKWKSLFTHSPP